MAAKVTQFCPKCRRTLEEKNFYTKRDGTKTELCKKCLTLHINNYDPETFLWILEMFDVPYVEFEWRKILDKKVAQDPDTIDGMSVLGRYLSIMKLSQWKNYRYNDTEDLKATLGGTEEQIQQAEQNREELQALYEAGKIGEAQYKTMLSTSLAEAEKENNPNYIDALFAGANNGSNSMVRSFSDEAVPANQRFMSESELPNPSDELTNDDKLYLAVKWGREWTPNEWVSLEKSYKEYCTSFEIADADTQNTLLLICKVNLKMNQALDSGDFDSFAKLNKTYEILRKTAKFTAAQNKEKQLEAYDSIGLLVAQCESESGFIPRFDTEIPRDIVDKTIQDLKAYSYKLAKQNLGIGQQLEMYMRRIEIQKELEKEDDSAGDLYDDFSFEEEEEGTPEGITLEEGAIF